MNVSQDLRTNPDLDARLVFPANIVIQIKALACKLPFEKGIPLSRFSSDEVASAAINRGIVAQISGSTVWRWLSEDAIKTWQYRRWLFPRDPTIRTEGDTSLELVSSPMARRSFKN